MGGGDLLKIWQKTNHTPNSIKISSQVWGVEHCRYYSKHIIRDIIPNNSNITTDRHYFKDHFFKLREFQTDIFTKNSTAIFSSHNFPYTTYSWESMYNLPFAHSLNTRKVVTIQNGL